MADNARSGSIGPKMSPHTKSVNDNPATEIAPLDVVELGEGPKKNEKTDCYMPARYEIAAQDRIGNPIKMIREDR